MKQVRNRPLANPIVLQEFVFNYREERTDQSSQPSFLKLSAKNSLEFNILKENDLFEQMQNRLDHLQNKHQQQLAEIVKAMKRKGYTKERKEDKGYGSKLVQQGTEKTAYREFKTEQYEKNHEIQQGNFQMDENRNYVKNTPLGIRSPQYKDSNIVSQTSFILSECSEKEEAILKNSNTSFKYNESISRSQLKLINSQQSRVSERKQSQTISRTKRKTTLSSNKQEPKRSRVYESILSQYSTAKLLAMQKSVI